MRSSLAKILHFLIINPPKNGMAMELNRQWMGVDLILADF
ncbi:hypothetical protein CBM2609_A100030 [Cupriavidus taiwanensis]|uniref:Uncharacterized protein n=1 Tax=Cupriavidus taiwanensis TaxID=164546 RepID=A0A375IYZ4_9BURK|nr:hypothetical protein CBM2604_A80030 [Cupriavidus taiwanensis]SOZ21706.1 hypothetical protein CBM2609_A100030 [Cupriavidus taiwanensis]SOZ41590.1 hypothetical protein CBM2610_A100031 [Cupriavidus taiwanensis]SPR96603.1 hypothetical protein CBM2634_A140021 [Cupriavidus taiwanensis]